MSIPALTDDERKALTDSRSDFTAEERVVVAMTFILSGGKAALAAARASKALDREVLASTLRQWRRRPWWVAAENAGKKRLQIELENGYTRIMHLTEQAIIDRVEDGDYKAVAVRDEDGRGRVEIERVPVSLRDLVGAHAIISEKRGMIRGEPGAEKADTGIALALRLAEAFHRMGQKGMQDASIEGEFTFVEPKGLPEPK